MRIVEVVDPILLDARVVSAEAECNCCCCNLRDVPNRVGCCFDGDELVLDTNGNQLFVTLGQFSIIRLERDIQLLMPAYDVCLPCRDCSNTGVGGETSSDPCEVFESFEFPIDEFFPPKQEGLGCQFVGGATLERCESLNSNCGCKDHSNRSCSGGAGCVNTGCGCGK